MIEVSNNHQRNIRWKSVNDVIGGIRSFVLNELYGDTTGLRILYSFATSCVTIEFIQNERFCESTYDVINTTVSLERLLYTRFATKFCDIGCNKHFPLAIDKKINYYFVDYKNFKIKFRELLGIMSSEHINIIKIKQFYVRVGNWFT